MNAQSSASLPFDALSFLGGSPNRARLLKTLSDEGATEREALVEATDLSRVTVKRILDDLHERGWVDATGRTYRVTPIGEVVSEEVHRLVETLAAMDRLAEVLPLFPSDFDVDVRYLADARVVLPTPADPLAPIRRCAELMGSARCIRGLGAGIVPDVLKVNRDAVVEDGQSFEVVFADELLGVVGSDERLTGWLREMLEAGASVYRHDDVDLLLGELDDVVFLGVADEFGVPRGSLESRDPMVREWFDATFERYREEATRISPDSFTL